MRECGPCNLCCRGYIRLDRVPFEIPPKSPCPHLRDFGCSIYEDRPEVPCRSFKCLWLQGFGEESDRPDQTKIIAYYPEGRNQIYAYVDGGSIPIKMFNDLLSFAQEQNKNLIIGFYDGYEPICEIQHDIV